MDLKATSSQKWSGVWPGRSSASPFPKGTRVKNIFVEKGRKLTVKEIAKKFLNNYVPKGVKA